MILNSVALEAIHKVWLDALERSVINPVIMEELDSTGKNTNNQSAINSIRADMVSIVGLRNHIRKYSHIYYNIQ